MVEEYSCGRKTVHYISKKKFYARQLQLDKARLSTPRSTNINFCVMSHLEATVKKICI